MADEDEQEPTPDWRHNHLKDRLSAAGNAAQSALDEIGASRGNPLEAVATRIQNAWTATGSRTRDDLLADVRGAGDGVRAAFARQRDDVDGDAATEPTRIDVEAHPELEWKTDPGRIDARASAASRGYR